jgi:FxsC-like protein
MAGGADPDFPLLFLSYARSHWDDSSNQRDADYWVKRFHGDLSTAIAEIIGASSRDVHLFIDRHIKVGQLWPNELVERLSTCAVFVPLYSAKYFTRPDCGREWTIIRMRQDMHISATSRCPNIVIPVVWKPIQPEHMPLWARDIQYLHESLDPVYNSMGLESLLRLRDYQDKYKAAVAALAARIVEVSRSEDKLRPLIEMPKFQTLHNAFAQEGNPLDHAANVRIVVAALDKHSTMAPGRSSVWYGDTPEEWCPYRDEQDPDGGHIPAAWRAAAVAERRDFVAHVDVLGSRSEELKPQESPSAPALVLVDAWATLDERWKALLQQLDGVTHNKPWIRVILPWNKRDTETTDNHKMLRAEIERALGRCLSAGRISSRRGGPGPGDSAAFGSVVGEAILLIQAAFMKNAEKHVPPGPYPEKPRLRGPGATPERRAGEETDEQP